MLVLVKTSLTRLKTRGEATSHTFSEIETMFSQLAKQSHWKLSADSAIAMSIFVLSTRFPTVKKMAVEEKSLALLLAGYFLRRRKFSILK